MAAGLSFGVTVLALGVAFATPGGYLVAQDSTSTSAVVEKAPRSSKHVAASNAIDRALVESYSLAKEFPPEQRIRHLMTLCSSASEIPSMGAKLRVWTEELYRIASELPPEDLLRSRAQSTAVANMATVDAGRALQMFDGLEMPAKAVTDSRPWVARIAFAKILEQQGLKAVPTLRRRARKLAESGPYPYSAMAPVIEKLKDKPDVARQIFSEALGYYRQGKDPVSSDMSFVFLLRGVHRLNVIPDWLIHEAAEELANHLVHAAESAPTPDPSAGFERLHWYFLSAFSVLQSIDPDVAAQVEAQAPAALSSRRSNADHTYREPERSDSFNDPELARFRAHSEELMARMTSLREDRQGDSDEMHTLISQALSEAQRQTQRAIELSPADEHDIKRNPSTLVSVVRLASRLSPEFTLQEIQSIEDSELKAYILIEFADAMQELNYVHELETTPEATPPKTQVK